MILVIGWIIRILVLLLLLRFAVRLFASISAAARTRPMPPRREVERAGGALVRDPQCGTYVAPSRAITMTAEGRTMQFCSVTCRDAWVAAHGR